MNINTVILTEAVIKVLQIMSGISNQKMNTASYLKSHTTTRQQVYDWVQNWSLLTSSFMYMSSKAASWLMPWQYPTSVLYTEYAASTWNSDCCLGTSYQHPFINTQYMIYVTVHTIIELSSINSYDNIKSQIISCVVKCGKIQTCNKMAVLPLLKMHVIRP